MGEDKLKEKVNDNIIFLNLIFQNAHMGLIGIDTVINKLNDERLAKIIKEQRAEYENIMDEAKEILFKYGANPEDISKLAQMSSKVMSEAMTMGADDAKIVKLMMEGNEKGVIAITEKLNLYKGKDKEVINLAHKLLDTEEHNRDEFKEFL